jgi:glycosyltransferase involved in cell wall biosynthesis
MLLTVFTPTYNRAYIIGKLYDSLCRQTCQDFEWLVIDDGSTDNTEQLIASFIAEHKIGIRYIKKENGGKHTAINLGVKEAKGDLFFIVDSDDSLTKDAINWILASAKDFIADNAFAGLSSTRIHPNGSRIGGAFPQKHYDCTALEIRNKYRINGDLAEIYKTDILRKFAFPEFKGERFSPEALVWNRIASSGYKLRYFDKGIYVCEYLDDGLTAAITRLRIRSPKATSLYYSEYYKIGLPRAEKIKTAINYWRFSPYYKHLSLTSKIKQVGILTLLVYPISFMMYLKDKQSLR